jgi:hypothetical protein
MKKLLSLTTLLLTLVVFISSAQSTFAATTTNYNQATVSWPYNSSVKCYNIYYGLTTKTQMKWSYSARCIPSSLKMLQYTIKYLNPGTSYSYTIASVAYSGKEVYWTPVQTLKTTQMIW